MPPEMVEPGQVITFRHLGFENFDLQVLAVMAGRMAVAALLGAIVAYRPWRRFMHWHFERPESGAQVLIAVAGGLMTAVIGNNVALAFALVGLGGFIRFRSGIKDPREAGVMFLMIGIGMACGIGMMPVALTATAFGIVLLTALDIADRNRRKLGRRRIRLSGVKDPRRVEPLVRSALERTVVIHGSRITLRNEEVVVDVLGDRIKSAGQVLDILASAGVPFDGDVSVEDI
ncbi:MAG TPA: DUF4956 domain-containing protein [Kofleriaceae bacterium]|nr:DUF4956 domain-containing protein [Kofleriaceae bacterium]